MILTLLGILSAFVLIGGDIPYIRDTLRRKTKPHRVTWGVVVILNIIGFANQLASGATNSLWLFGAAVLITSIIFLTSIKYGTGGHTKTDIFSLVFCLLGLGLWAIFDSPLMSILANVVIVFVALTPTIIKARRTPESETKIAWLCGAISSLLASISVGKLDIKLLLLPLQAMFIQAYIASILYSQANRKKPIES